MSERTRVEGKVKLPPIPSKRYFTIGEVSELCAIKPYVLRYWEQEFAQLKQVKRRGNRRYYQPHEVMLVRQIRVLLYDYGFTIHGARQKLDARVGVVGQEEVLQAKVDGALEKIEEVEKVEKVKNKEDSLLLIRAELFEILKLLEV